MQCDYSPKNSKQMKQISVEEYFSNNEFLSQWINEGRFVTIFEAKRKTGFYDDTHYVKSALYPPIKACGT